MADNREDLNTKNREDKRLQYLHDLSDYKVADGDPDVRGWALMDANNERIGTVENLLVDVEKEKVRYLDVDLDESLLSEDHEPLTDTDPSRPHEFITRDGATHMIVPIGMATLDKDNHTVVSREVNRDKYVQTRRYNKGTPITPDYERDVLSTLIGPTAIPRPERSTDKNPIRRDENFYNANYFNEDSFYGRRRNTIK